MGMSFAGCASLMAEAIARTVNDPGPTETVAMIPFGPPSDTPELVHQQTRLDSERCAESARVMAGHRIGSHAFRARLATEVYVLCMVRRGYRCEHRAAHETCGQAWTHPTATRAQLFRDGGECLRGVFFVFLASTRHARWVECMHSKGYRADVGESSDAATPAKPSRTPGELNWPPVGASYQQSIRTSGSFGSGEETRTVRYLGEQTWLGNAVRAFSDGAVTTYVDDQRRLIARVESESGRLIETYEPHFVMADWPLYVGKSWRNRYRYSDHELGRIFADAQHDAEVEAYEDVETRAGIFKSFRISMGGTSSKTVLWYSDELGLVIKLRTERLSNHYRGEGVREVEIISYDFGPGR